MGYFKKRREVKEKARKAEVLCAILDQSKITGTIVQIEVSRALREVDAKKFEYENNMRENLDNALLSDEISDDLIDEVADVIEKGMQLYSYKIAESKRRKLAEDILNELSIKK